MKENNRIKKKSNSTNIFKRAFTLVELVVVIAIIAVLSGVSVAGYFGYVNMTKNTVADADAREILTQYNLWYAGEHNVGNDLFTSLDDFKDYLINEKAISEKYSANPKLNYYVEADSLEADYKVTMFYTNKSGAVAEYQISANATDVSGQISLVKSNYSNLTAALSGKTAALSNAALTENALQYKADENGDYQICMDQYNLFENNDTNKGYTNYIEGYSLYSSFDEIKDKFLEIMEIDYDTFVLMMGVKFAIPTVENNLQNTIQIRKGQKFSAELGSKGKIDIGVVPKYIQYGDMSLKTISGKQVELVNNFKLFSNSENPANEDSVDNRSLFVSFSNSGSTPSGFGATLNSVLTYQQNSSIPLDIYLRPLYQDAGNSNQINGDVTIKESDKLIIAYDNVSYNYYGRSSKVVKKESSTPSSAQTVTIKSGSTLTIKGEVNLGAALGFGQPYTSILQNNKFVNLEIEQGAKVVVDGGTLNCYGTITGKGTIEVINGGKVVEPLAANDWRGGANATGTIAHDVFPFLNYDVKNISCPMTFDSTSCYELDTYVVMSGMINNVSFSFIGNNGMFKLNSGKVTKEVDSDGKLVVSLSENAELVDQDKPIDVSVKPIDITKVAFPISKIILNVNDGCTMTLSSLLLKVLPTSTINVNGTGKLIINEKATLAVYDEFNAYKDETLNTKLADYRYTDTRNLGTFGLNLASSSSLTVNGTLSGNVGGTGKIITGANAKFTSQFSEGYQLGASAAYVDRTAQQDPLVGTYNGTPLEAGKEYPTA